MTTHAYPNPDARTGPTGPGTGPDLGRVAFLAGVVGAGALVLCLLLGVISGWAGFFHAYLLSFMFWASLTLGSIAMMMLYQVVGGRWGDILRPYFETAAKAVPLIAVLFIPLLLGLAYNYPWMQEAHRDNPLVKFQAEKWLYPSFFTVRAAIYFAIWFAMAWFLTRGGRAKDLREPTEGSEVGRSPTLAAFSGPGIILFVVVLTLAAVDWAMSVEPGWFSTIYGLLLLVGQGLSTMAFMTVALMFLGRTVPGEAQQERESVAEEAGKPPAAGAGAPAIAGHPDSLADRAAHDTRDGGEGLHAEKLPSGGATAGVPATEAHVGGTSVYSTGVVDYAGPHLDDDDDDEDDEAHHARPAISPSDWGDMGNLMLLFTMLWAYLNLSQFLIVWSGNIPTETVFYHPRILTSWKWVGLLLVLLHFAVPFFALITRDVKRNGQRLVLVALLILVMRQVDFYWQLQPSFAGGHHGITLYVANLLMPIAIGGIWIAHFAWQFRGRRVLPQPLAGGHHG